jgi:hypothetical protein
VNHAALLAALAGFPDRLAEAARDASLRPTPPGEWDPTQVVRHLIAVETEVHQARLADLATRDDPRWDWAEPGPWAGEPDLTLDVMLTRFAGLRASTTGAVVALDDEGWARTGTHSRLGVWDVAGLLNNAVSHDDEHLRGLATG